MRLEEGDKLEHVLYIDETVLMAEVREGVPCIIDEFGRTYMRTELKINIDKSKALDQSAI